MAPESRTINNTTWKTINRAQRGVEAKERLALINLARTWTRAAERNEHPRSR